MIFEDELESAIREEMLRMNRAILSGGLDMRTYDRYVGGYHALLLVLEEKIPDTRKKLNER
jgi:hypothetical protein